MTTLHDLETGARTIYGEARGSTFADRVAIAHVIMNRVLADLWNDRKPDWWGEGIEGVCLKAWQFSCWNANDPNRLVIERAGFDDPLLTECMGIMALVASARTGQRSNSLAADPTFGSTHYKVRSLPWPKDWGPEKPSTAEIGAHSFYNSIERGLPAAGA